MQNISRAVVRYAQQVARDVDARSLVLYTDAIGRDDDLGHILQSLEFPAVLVTRSREPRVPPGRARHTWITVPDIPMTRAAQFKSALLVCVARRVLNQGDRVVFVGGADGSDTLDAAFVFHVGNLPDLFSLVDPAALVGEVAPEVFERVITLASQLAVEGREGRPVGTLFVVGDSERVLAQSRSLVLNPFQGHPESQRNILDPAVEETVKEFSALDGAFVVRDDGVVLSAGTHLLLSVPHSQLPGGLGTRHAAAAGITASTDAVAVCVSQSTGSVTVFKAGRLVTSLARPAAGDRLTRLGAGMADDPPAEPRRPDAGPPMVPPPGVAGPVPAAAARW
jgi:hypothetical protein